MTSWRAHGFVLVVAILIYVAKWPLLILAVIWLLLLGYMNLVLYLAPRYPRTMFVILALLRGLLGGGRRR